MLQLNDIHSFYAKSHILHGVSFRVDNGELVTLLGRNGVGKTTTMKSIMGIVSVRSGTIQYKGGNIIGKKPYEIFRQGLAYVPQGRKIFSTLNVAENLNLALRQHNPEKLEWVLDIFPRLRQRLHHIGNELSGGEQQMLAIARVLVCEPEMILLDEPSEGLAPVMTRSILSTLEELKKTGATVLLVEANLSMAMDLGDRHYIMDQGIIVSEVTTQQLSEDEELLDKYFRI